MCSVVGRAWFTNRVVSLVPSGAVVIVMSEQGRLLAARFAHVDEDYKV